MQNATYLIQDDSIDGDKESQIFTLNNLKISINFIQWNKI